MNRSEELLVISQISLLHKQVMHWIIAKDADGNAWNSSKDNARDWKEDAEEKIERVK